MLTHDKIERNVGLFIVLTILTISVGGLLEIVPLFFQKSTTTPTNELVKPYSPLRLSGRDIYIREGCYNCHSQMIRGLVGDVLRYGKSGRLTESIYDFPYQWGSKRTGPDIQRVGGKYPNIWHFQHMMDPRSTSIGSVMPNYPWLYKQITDIPALSSKIRVLTGYGVPYPPRSPDAILQSCIDQAQGITEDLAKNGIKIGPEKEVIAVIAYLQQLGRYSAPAAQPAAPAPGVSAPAAPKQASAN